MVIQTLRIFRAKSIIIFTLCLKSKVIHLNYILSCAFLNQIQYYFEYQISAITFDQILFMLCFFLCFNIKNLQSYILSQAIHMKTNKIQWSQQEISLLKELIPLFNSKKWKNISRIFKEKGFQRSQTQCRQKWVNFFNPKIKNEDWSKQELQILYEAYSKHKTQWYLIEKLLPGRTQNKIKNRFYGSLRNFVRFIIRVFNKDSKSYSTEINKLSPKYLNMVYQSQGSFQFLKGEVPIVMKELGYLFDRNQFSKKIKEKRQLYYQLFQKIIGIFNTNTIQSSIQENEEINNQSQNREIQRNEQIQRKQYFQQLQGQMYINNPYIYPNCYFYYGNYYQ